MAILFNKEKTQKKVVKKSYEITIENHTANTFREVNLYASDFGLSELLGLLQVQNNVGVSIVMYQIMDYYNANPKYLRVLFYNYSNEAKTYTWTFNANGYE